ncbi:hypothetical protein TNCT_282931 [Trichonephila clavata]|uniref:Uncharacterized protein n=1 Tax=Trichonephila clavata TaxID=2740835 RepID=A0A8X6JMK7_TRICU|nr:hypothetical protein TNCT_282931 [Trichonephila clavata]
MERKYKEEISWENKKHSSSRKGIKLLPIFRALFFLYAYQEIGKPLKSFECETETIHIARASLRTIKQRKHQLEPTLPIASRANKKSH